MRLVSFKVRTDAPLPRREPSSGGRRGTVLESRVLALLIFVLERVRWRSPGASTKERDGDGWRLGCNGGARRILIVDD